MTCWLEACRWGRGMEDSIQLWYERIGQWVWQWMLW